MRRILAAGLAVAALAWASAAQAMVIMGTFTGDIIAGVDTDGIFAAPGTDLAGKLFSMIYCFDSADATIVDGQFPSGSPSVPGSVALSIGGALLDEPVAEISYFKARIGLSPATLLPRYYDIVFDAGAGSGSFSFNFDWSGLSASSVSNVSNDPVFSGDLDGRFLNITLGLDENLLGEATHFEFNIPAVADVPEPGGWSLLLLGVSGLGAALRHRRRAYCAAA